ncbi:hypothetical protein AWJ20_3296 [Sugiyamaella lignohabitans]|uniref:Transcription factor domain-containing protein n=1 Tax=Sugiyamaella lignohabitans TaxID=796027 RepID=A0A167FSS8_9ASCO|nr:uncharacterized protein AWJ20_3296 [Sugiyamaella lignohabitans]ANB15658.1 hypothetical protein AWJ20_3296 [Sugiyamaella lignohabitans]
MRIAYTKNVEHRGKSGVSNCCVPVIVGLTSRFDTSEVIYEKLSKIEQLLANHDSLLMALVDQVKDRELSSPLSYSSVGGRKNSYVESDTNISGDDSDLALIQTGNLPPLTIPTGHNTAAIRVLRLPQVKALIGEYPRDYFYEIEARRKVFGLETVSDQPYLDQEVCDGLIEAFRTTAHAHRPILDYNNLLSLYKDMFANGFTWTIETAIVLLALALGEVASADYSKISRLTDDPNWEMPGISYFRPAFEIISKSSALDFGVNILVVQAQVLASIYFAYIAYPLYSWRLIHAASTTIELLLSRTSNNEPPADEEIRLFWCCFLTESDRLAEFELPRTGIGSMVDDMLLPSVLNEDAVIIYFLAEISIRRLLNRVHNTLYTDDGDAKAKSIQTLLIISEELNRQLETWYDSIPSAVRPTLGMNAPENLNEREIILRVRYYACRHIIFRPFVLRVIANPEVNYPVEVLENCAKCISSIRMYIHNVGYVLSRPSSYTWTLGMSSLGAVLVITAASQSPVLQGYLPDILELQNTVLKNFLPWATPESSIQSITWILEHILHRQQFNFK